MPQIPERTIYSIEEAAASSAQSVDYLLNGAALGKLEFFVYVPGNIQIFIADVSDSQGPEWLSSMRAAHNRLLYDRTPLRTENIEVLMLSASDCQKISLRGTFYQDEFLSAGKFNKRSQIQRIRPTKPPKDKYGIGLRYSWPRNFGTYIGSLSADPRRQEIAPERKALLLTANNLYVSAKELLGYTNTLPPAEPLPTVPKGIHDESAEVVIKAKEERSFDAFSHLTNELLGYTTLPPAAPLPAILKKIDKKPTEVIRKTKKMRSLDSVSVLIKEAYLKAKDPDESESTWLELIEMARLTPPRRPLIGLRPKGILYKNDSDKKQLLDQRKFKDRWNTVRERVKRK